MKIKSYLKDNGLSIVFFALFVISLVGQAFTGLLEHNKDLQKEGAQSVRMAEYLTSGHFLQATFENWESEFLQMSLFLILSVFLYQKGSSESKDPDKEEDVDKTPNPGKKDAPWPVRKGGIILTLYSHSMLIALGSLFILSFIIHWHGSLRDFNEEQLLQGELPSSAIAYLGHSRFWFESFQNWQSEFLSILAIVVLSIFLREIGSPQSKPVDASNSETGD